MSTILLVILASFFLITTLVFRSLYHTMEDLRESLAREYTNDKEYWRDRDRNRVEALYEKDLHKTELVNAHKADKAKSFKVLAAIAKTLLKQGEELKAANDSSNPGPVIGFIFKRLEDSNKGVAALSAANEELHKRNNALESKLSIIFKALEDVHLYSANQPKIARPSFASQIPCDSIHPGMTLQDMHDSKDRQTSPVYVYDATLLGALQRGEDLTPEQEAEFQKARSHPAYAYGLVKGVRMAKL